jgi:hypothetical protein
MSNAKKFPPPVIGLPEWTANPIPRGLPTSPVRSSVKREFRRPELKPTAPGRESVLKFSRHSMLLVVSMPTPGARSEASVGQAVLGGRRRSDRSARPSGRRSRRRGHRLDSHRFVAVEYVCICGDAGPPHTFKIAEIRPAGSSNQGVASEVLLRRGKLALAVRRMQG